MNHQPTIDDLDEQILEALDPDRGVKIKKLAHVLHVKENTLRYRLLCLQAMGRARTVKRRGSTQYFSTALVRTEAP